MSKSGDFNRRDTFDVAAGTALDFGDFDGVKDGGLWSLGAFEGISNILGGGVLIELALLGMC